MKIAWKYYLQKSQKTRTDMITKWNLVGNSELWLTFEKMIFIPLFPTVYFEVLEVINDMGGQGEN